MENKSATYYFCSSLGKKKREKCLRREDCSWIKGLFATRWWWRRKTKSFSSSVRLSRFLLFSPNAKFVLMKKANTAFRMHRSTYLIFKDSSTESSSTSPTYGRVCETPCNVVEIIWTQQSALLFHSAPSKQHFFVLFSSDAVDFWPARLRRCEWRAIFPSFMQSHYMLKFRFPCCLCLRSRNALGVRVSRRVSSRSRPFHDLFYVANAWMQNLYIKGKNLMIFLRAALVTIQIPRG